MKKPHLIVLLVLACAFVAFPAAAQDGSDSGGLGLAGAALGLGIAAAGGALGQGRAAGEACAGMARNPGASGRIQTALLLSLAFMESLVIFTWVMTFLIQGR